MSETAIKDRRSTDIPPSDVAAHLFEDIARLTADVEGISRPAYSAIETKALFHLETFAQAQGLATHFDAGQNLIMSLPRDAEADRYVLVGSHIDSVPRGGNFDGLAGILAGLVCLIRAQREGAGFSRPVKVIAMRGEESAWFGPCYIASKLLLGRLDPDELKAIHKADGHSLGSHMQSVGIDLDRAHAGEPIIDPDKLMAYVELHIEQGPLLIEKNLPAAIVSGIRGNFRHRNVQCIGEAGHSGAVPRAFRRDPVLAMADLMTRLDESWLTILQKGEDLVLTSGMVGTDPDTHALSRIPDRISFSLDIRSQSAAALDEMRALVAHEIRTIERNRKVRFALGEELSAPPALCDPAVVAALTSAMARVGLDPFVMPSGGGHDAAEFANAGVPTGMIFVRNRNGSHNPDEAMEISDFMAGADILYTFLMDETS